MSELMNGKELAEKMQAEIAIKVNELNERHPSRISCFISW